MDVTPSSGVSRAAAFYPRRRGFGTGRVLPSRHGPNGAKSPSASPPAPGGGSPRGGDARLLSSRWESLPARDRERRDAPAHGIGRPGFPPARGTRSRLRSPVLRAGPRREARAASRDEGNRARRADDPGVGRPISRDLRARAGPRRSGTRAREFRMGDARLWIAPAAGSAAPPGASGRSALRFAMSGFWPSLLAVTAILLVAGA